MAKLLMLQGLPASGKSTYSKEIANSGNYVRVNRDLLRTMLHWDKFTPKNEGLTVDVEKAIVRAALQSKSNVVVDDCNLSEKHKNMWKDIAQKEGATFGIERFDTPIEECVRRDLLRDKSVGEGVIKTMALQYSLEGVPMENIVLCDIDGTIADVEHRRHFVEGEKNWHAFFEAMDEDPVRESTKELLVNYTNLGKTIIFVSARPEKYRLCTQQWLAKHNMGTLYWALIMRRDGDHRPDTEVKSEIYEKYFKNKKIETVIDDRPRIISMWREKGLNVIDVGNGIDF